MTCVARVSGEGVGWVGGDREWRRARLKTVEHFLLQLYEKNGEARKRED